MAEFFTEVTERIPYEGPDSDNPLAFHCYDADRVVAGRRMEDHLRFAVCYWHSFNWDGFDIFGAGTLDRPWHPTFAPAADPLEAARQKMAAAFEFFAKLGVPFYCFHDRDIAPEGGSFKESAALLDEMVDEAAEHQERTGVQLLWGTANLFSNPRYQAGAATNPDPEVFAYAAAQVAHCLEATHRLGGQNYVLWGGREGYDTLLNTDLRRELDQLARFLSMVVEHKHAIGFTGAILLEPKPFEPTKHQYDFDVAGGARLPAALRPRRRDQGQHRGQPRHAVGPRLRPRDRHRGQRRHLRVDRRQRRRRPARLGRRPLPGVGRADGARHARDPARRRVHDRRAELRRQAAPAVDRPDRPVPRPHRRDGHDGAGAARRGGDPRRARRQPRRPVRGLGRRARAVDPRRDAARCRRCTSGRSIAASRRGCRAARSGSRTSSPATWPASADGARRRRRLVDLGHQGRGPRPRQRTGRRARVVAAPADPAAAVGAGARRRGGRRSSRRGAQAGEPAVAAISVAGQQHGMVALDEHREVLRPAKLWNDTESAPDAAWLIGQLPGGRQAWADACGLVPVASFTITKLSWLHRSEPETWRRLAHVVLPHDWLTFRLTGQLVTDRGDASGTGYWSAATGSYRDDLLAVVDGERDWSAAVPAVLGPARRRRRVARARWSPPAPATTWRVRSASGCAPGDVAVSIGTSGTVYSVSDEPIADPSGIVAGFADATGRHLPLVCTLNATKVTEAVRRLLGVDHDAFDELALAAAPGAGGLTLLPYLDGERTPDRPGGDRRAGRDPQRRHAASSSPGPPSRASCAGSSTGSTRWPRSHRPTGA